MIDQGGHASRVLVIDRHGRPVAEARRPVSVSQPRPGWVEQDAGQIVASVREALADVAIQLGSACRQLRAAGLATQRSTLVCWDRRSGAPLSPAISWQDRRAAQWMRPFAAQRAKIRAITGLLPNAHYGVSKLHWCLQHLSAVRAARERGSLACGPLASFLLSNLLEEHPLLVDAVNASRTLLWDWRQRRWSAELLELFGLEKDYLPRGVATRYDFGPLAIGDLRVPLTVCTGDQPAALFAAGAPETGKAYINMGTGAFLQCVMPPSVAATDSPAQANLLRSVVWDEAETSIQVLEATVNGAGSALSVVAGELGIAGEEVQKYSAAWLTNADSIPLYLNGIGGLGSPLWREDFASGFAGPEASSATAPAKLVAVLESIIFLLVVNLEAMQGAGIPLQRIVLSGGLSVLDGLCQRLADICGLPVQRATQAEATAHGLAFLLAGSRAVWQKDAEDTVFSARENPALLERYRHWRDAMDEALGVQPAAQEADH